MRRRHVLVLPALFVVTGLLAGGCDQSNTPGMIEGTLAYSAARPPVKVDPTAVTPPRPTSAFPQASSGPGTPIFVPKTVQPDVVAFVQGVLDRAKDLAAKGQTDEAVRAVEGLRLKRSSWSLATEEVLDPQIAAAQKSLQAGQPTNQ